MATRSLSLLIVFSLLAATPVFAGAQDGIAALEHQDYPRAVRIFRPLAERGDPVAQTYLGYMYYYGYGVPQNYIEAAVLLNAAADQGSGLAQYLLGLMYDKGQGVPQDYVQAYKWLDLAVATTRGRQRDDWVRIRDAIGLKLSLEQRTKAQALALEWRPRIVP
jgi:uncharacterized protein